jgi:hypothetical protein
MNKSSHPAVFQVLPEELPKSFCILSAWNPDEHTDSPDSNNARDKALAERIDTFSLTRVRVAILSSDGARGEPGWAVDCPISQGAVLAREFRRKSMYFVTDGELVQIGCEDGKQTALGCFAEHLRDPRHCRLFTIYLGSPSPRARLLPTEEFGIRTRVARYFESFTLSKAEGFFRGQTEDTLLISAATAAPARVLELATELLEYTRQQGVGVSYNGIYQRVTSWSDPEFLLRAWELEHPAAVRDSMEPARAKSAPEENQQEPA